MPIRPFEAYPGSEPYVFASYAHADRDVVFADLKWLHDAGFRVWYDEGIDLTENWDEVIARRITACAVFLVFVSPAATASKWVRQELSFADRQNRPILPVFLSDTRLDAKLDFAIGGVQSIFRHELPGPEFQARIDRQLRKYDGLCYRPPSSAPSFAEELRKTLSAKRAAAPSGYVLANWFQPGATTGSDLFESRVLPDGRWLVAVADVADVAGEGPPAALVGALLTGMLDVAVSAAAGNLVEAVTRVNAAFCRRATDRLVTLSAVVLDPATHRFTAVNAGHLPPLLRRASGEGWRFPDGCTGLPLGVLPGVDYEPVEDVLEPGDTLLLVTDGVTDAMTPGGTVLGLEGVRRVAGCVPASPGGVVESLRAALSSYTDGRRFADDVTVVCVGRNPPG